MEFADQYTKKPGLSKAGDMIRLKSHNLCRMSRDEHKVWGSIRVLKRGEWNTKKMITKGPVGSIWHGRGVALACLQ